MSEEKEELSLAIEHLRWIRANDPNLWLALWKIPDGQTFGRFKWLSGTGWSNLPGAWVTPEYYAKAKEIASKRADTNPRNAEQERVLREAGETKLIETRTGWDDTPIE